MYPASAIAYAFVKKGIEDELPVTQMKLQKMVYFAQGVHMARGFGPLISENFFAWKYGPVVPSLYQEYKLYGSGLIDNTEMVRLMNTSAEISCSRLDENARESIRITWELLKNVDAIRLSAWTHTLGSPWQKNYVEFLENVEIPNQEIGEYFKSQLIKQA